MTTEQSNRRPFGPKQLVDILRQTPGDEACDSCLAQLDAYLSAQLASDDYDSIYKETAMHLDSCVSCSTAYDLLYDVRLAEQENRLPAPTAVPDPNLDFLRQDAPSLLEKFATALNVTTERLTLQFDQLLLSLSIQAEAGQVALVRSSGNGRYTHKLFQLSSDQLPGDTVPLTISAYRDNQQDGVCLVEVNVEPPGKAWPELADIEVNLSTRVQNEKSVTDEWGTAVFPTVQTSQLGSLRLMVNFQNTTRH